MSEIYSTESSFAYCRSLHQNKYTMYTCMRQKCDGSKTQTQLKQLIALVQRQIRLRDVRSETRISGRIFMTS